MDVEERSLNYRLNHVEPMVYFAVRVMQTKREEVVHREVPKTVLALKVIGRVVVVVLSSLLCRLLHEIQRILSVLIALRRVRARTGYKNMILYVTRTKGTLIYTLPVRLMVARN